MSEARLIVGLGNPGAEYEKTRHNAGFLAVDLIASVLGVSYWKDTCGAKVAVVHYAGSQLVLAKPQSFMNLSGGPVKRLIEAYSAAVGEMIVIHDELDLAPGDVRAKSGGGHAGHNGLRSIHDKLGTDAYLRVRVGIGRPPGRMQVSDYVLQEPRGEGRELFDEAVERATRCALHVVDKGIQSAMREFNGPSAGSPSGS